jgi:hypothetical protein
MRNPEVFMEALRAALAGGRGRVMITTGNVGFFVVRFGLFFGQFMAEAKARPTVSRLLDETLASRESE